MNYKVELEDIETLIEEAKAHEYEKRLSFIFKKLHKKGLKSIINFSPEEKAILFDFVYSLLTELNGIDNYFKDLYKIAKKLTYEEFIDRLVKDKKLNKDFLMFTSLIIS